ncbi:cytochrome P450 [Plectosphaerella plurivora]|uniref:Cytochrome P450 n=1 Tax=Plectosphaerella plurivora TaxID=936078 RepID=A0A9P8VIC1_9PEZI|nr:cytochrome P450 [Plectosphaerella plurivora]
METLNMLDTPTGMGIAAVATTASAYALYRRLLPKPIPGIPYNQEAVNSLLGDLPAMVRETVDGSGLDWIVSQARNHPGPLFQIFLQPFGDPFLLLSDFREAQDVFLRRSHEWDRSDWSIEMIGGVGAHHHINLKAGPVWKAHRRLVQDLMTPTFLHSVAAPNIYESVLDLIQLWDLKARESGGHPFSALDDIYDAAMDAVIAFSFGTQYPHRAVRPQLHILRDGDRAVLQKARDAASDGDAIVFPRAETHETIAATYKASKSIGEVINFPRARYGWYWKKFDLSERRATRIRHGYLKEQVEAGVERLKARSQEDAEGEEWAKSAVDLMLDRETKFAAKEGREPVYWSPTMRDEILGFIIAGHDTTSTTMLWGLKHLTDAPAVQDKLRAALREAHPNAVEESRAPSAHEITHTTVPYLEAVIEENLRLAGTLPVLERQCNRDTTILGHFVPKGTTMIVLGVGPGITEPGPSVDEALRSPTSQSAAKERGVRSWEGDDWGVFRPERWLGGEAGSESFDSTAGPTMAFGFGLRGCFGRRLAYVEMRIMITLLIWRFKLLECPEKLSGYGATDELTRKPQQCYVRLEPVA